MDKYDKAIAYLEQHPEEIVIAWGSYLTHPAGVLFQYAVPDPYDTTRRQSDGKNCGCLTMIKSPLNQYVAWTDELTEAIRNSTLPTGPEKITLELLPEFAKWQRRIDLILGRDGAQQPELTEAPAEEKVTAPSP